MTFDAKELSDIVAAASRKVGNNATPSDIFSCIGEADIEKYNVFNVIVCISRMIRTGKIKIKTEIVEKRNRRR